VATRRATLFRSRARLAAAALAALLVGGCASCLAADPDGTPWSARLLPFGTAHRDQLLCTVGRFFGRHNDCADWFRIEPKGPERVRVELHVTGRGTPPPPVQLTLMDPEYKALEVRQSTGDGVLELSFVPEHDRYFLGVEPFQARKTLRQYEIRATQDLPPPPPPPPPPQPTFKKVRAEVLEVEREPSGNLSVMIDFSRAQGARAGLRGRLVEGAATLSEIEITEVFEDGSRAALRSAPSATITPRTQAEVDVPTGEPE
jgi:hypothetical protein